MRRTLSLVIIALLFFSLGQQVAPPQAQITHIIGTGSPEGVYTAGVGSKYTRRDGGQGTTEYTKESGSGNTGWVPVNTASTTYLTGNQSVTLSGDISGTGSTSITAVIGTSKVTNSMLAGSIDLASKVSGILPATSHPALSGDISTPSGSVVTTIGASKVTNAMLAGSIDLTTKVTGVLPYANGGDAGSAATSATTGTMTVNMTTSLVTITPTGACTLNASGGVTGQVCTIAVTTSGTSSFIVTFGTNFVSAGTLATGTVSGKKFSVTFRCINGTSWQEIGRTGAM